MNSILSFLIGILLSFGVVLFTNRSSNSSNTQRASFPPIYNSDFKLIHEKFDQGFNTLVSEKWLIQYKNFISNDIMENQIAKSIHGLLSKSKEDEFYQVNRTSTSPVLLIYGDTSIGKKVSLSDTLRKMKAKDKKQFSYVFINSITELLPKHLTAGFSVKDMRAKIAESFYVPVANRLLDLLPEAELETIESDYMFQFIVDIFRRYLNFRHANYKNLRYDPFIFIYCEQNHEIEFISRIADEMQKQKIFIQLIIVSDLPVAQFIFQGLQERKVPTSLLYLVEMGPKISCKYIKERFKLSDDIANAIESISGGKYPNIEKFQLLSQHEHAINLKNVSSKQQIESIKQEIEAELWNSTLTLLPEHNSPNKSNSTQTNYQSVSLLIKNVFTSLQGKDLMKEVRPMLGEEEDDIELVDLTEEEKRKLILELIEKEEGKIKQEEDHLVDTFLLDVPVEEETQNYLKKFTDGFQFTSGKLFSSRSMLYFVKRLLKQSNK